MIFEIKIVCDGCGERAVLASSIGNAGGGGKRQWHLCSRCTEIYGGLMCMYTGDPKSQTEIMLWTQEEREREGKGS